MSKLLMDHLTQVENPRIAEMVRYPLVVVLSTVVVGLLCRCDELDDSVELCEDMLDWMRRYYPFANGIPPAQTIRRTLARLDPRRLEEVFAIWVQSLGALAARLIAIDRKTVRVSRLEADGTGAVHLVQVFAHEDGLTLARRARARAPE